ncbi:recombinase-like helix-turn-helix domain-containing protein [Burkholderia guangdongensis]|uniref:recombinase-like helix-turn-helix domain-containing protein n=1 Tax=Burkholderia guangdongensis TaxID=1792500 RepID=UPI0015CB920C|nr:recombinase-like helix-turn-helix domain-containing protein [Burkholderia guangdongensis]
MKEATVNFNPYLKPWKAPEPNNVAGKGQIEQPGQVENQIWQTRKAEPTRYENDFGDALEQVFGAGATELADVVDGLNRLGFRTPDGALWTTERFRSEVASLAE